MAADAELRRRHPGRYFAPLRSAEPPPATGAQRAEAHPDGGGGDPGDRPVDQGVGRGAPDIRLPAGRPAERDHPAGAAGGRRRPLPEPNGEQVVTRSAGPLGQLLDKLDELTGEREP